MDFVPFPKIARWSRPVLLTEKLDGTNAGIYISDDLQTMLFASRTRWITPEEDNHGFAKWATANRDELLKLGPGMHYGEFWGSGIQRGYGLAKGEKRFSLFNVSRWSDDAVRPSCCHVVPTLYEGMLSDVVLEHQLDNLRLEGSRAAPGFMNPEGVVIYHRHSGQLFKKTLTRDEEPKGKRG
jgi:hypothetical protein